MSFDACLKVTQESAETWRLLCHDLFGNDAEAVALELMHLPSGVATTPMGELLEQMAETEREVVEFEVRQRAAELETEESTRGQNEAHGSPVPLVTSMQVDANGETNLPRTPEITLPAPSFRPARPVVQLINLHYVTVSRDLQLGAAARHKPNVSQSKSETPYLVWKQDELEWKLELHKKGKLSEIVLFCASEPAGTPTSIEWMTTRTGQIERISLVARGQNVFDVQLKLGYAVSRFEAIKTLRDESADPSLVEERIPVVKFGN
jgi:hypothetical protein